MSSERPVTVEELFAEELASGIGIASLERREYSYVELTGSEQAKVLEAFDSGLAHLRKVLPEVADDIERQRSLVVKFAGVAKATFPSLKNYEHPSVPGSLGATWIFPQALKYAATPSSTYPCYTSYKTNSWDIDLTAGTAAYLFGDGTNFYRASPTTNQHSFLLVFQNGIVEFGSTPKIQQFRLISEGKQDYGIYSVEPLVEIEVERGKLAYQYPTPLGALPISYDRGVMWGVMPSETGTSTLKLLGMVFYEHDFASSLTWVS